LTVKKFTLGRPQGKIFEAARKIIRSCCSRDVSKHKKNEGSDQGAFGLISSISAAVLSMLRLRMARRATREALKGNLVLVDRWPTDETGMMDGPRLSCNKDHPAIFNVLYSIENWAYSRMPRADICFFLQVPVEILIKRNEERVKSEKETDEEIRNRYQGNQDFVPLAGKIIRFDNNGPFEVKRKGLMLRIWQEIVAIQAGF
jgi:thymidylate kinase